MVFEIIEKIREFLIEKNDVFVQLKLKEEEEEKIREENVGKKYISEIRLDFIPVNKETFSEWLAKFTAEREKIKEEEKASRTKQMIERDVRNTGKAYFLEKQGTLSPPLSAPYYIYVTPALNTLYHIIYRNRRVQHCDR
jgi:hypothetical protein